MEYKSIFSEDKSIEGRTVSGIAAVFGNVDDGGDLIQPGAFRKTLKEGRKRVRHLWQHDAFSPPVAAILDLKEIGRQDLPASIQKEYPEAAGGLQVVREYLNTPRGNEILEGLKTGAINEMSFGYDAVKWEIEKTDTRQVRILKELRLYDTSDVNWGMNAATVASKGLKFRDTGTDEDTAWQQPGLQDYTDLQKSWSDLPDQEKTRIAEHFGWAVSLPADEFDQLQLPHHLPVKNGVGPVSWPGLQAAMSALFQPAAAEIPAADLKNVYDHLKEHFGQFGKTAPAFQLVEISRAAAEIISAADLENIDIQKNWLQLQEYLKAALDILRAEPLAAVDQLTALTLKRRIEIYSHETFLQNF